MNIYTIYSESHVKLFEQFKKSLEKTGGWYRLIARQAPQYGSGDYPGSAEFWKLNIEYFLEICEKEKEPFLYLDCDVMVLKDPTEDLVLGMYEDILAQLDKRLFGIYPQLCTGIMYIYPSDKIKRMFEWMLRNIEKYKNDQKALNRYLLFDTSIIWRALPKTYYSINFDNGDKVWDGGELKFKKRDYKMIHLNWCVGNKLELWKEIEKRI